MAGRLLIFHRRFERLCCQWHRRAFLLRMRDAAHPMILQPDMVQRECNRVERLFALLRLQLALPHRDAVPPHLSQSALLLLVTFLVPANLRHPELTVRLRNLATLRILNTLYFIFCVQRDFVPMPEAPVHEDTRPVFPQHQIRMPWQPLVIEPIAESPLPQPTPHNHLGFRILPPDGRHIG